VFSYLDVRPYDPEVQVDELIPFETFAAITGRKGGLEKVWTASARSGFQDWLEVPLQETTYSIWTDKNFVFETTNLRLGYSSFVTPRQIISYNTERNDIVILKRQEVPGYEPEKYTSRRIEATARDGTKIPMSIVYHKTAGTCRV
jgi:oligopeptidase B